MGREALWVLENTFVLSPVFSQTRPLVRNAVKKTLNEECCQAQQHEHSGELQLQHKENQITATLTLRKCHHFDIHKAA